MAGAVPQGLPSFPPARISNSVNALRKTYEKHQPSLRSVTSGDISRELAKDGHEPTFKGLNTIFHFLLSDTGTLCYQ